MKIVYWSPYVGHVGTIKAVINSAVAMKRYGGHEVVLIKNHTEWEGFEGGIEEAGIRIVDFGLKKWLPGLDRIKVMGSRLYMLTVAAFGFFQVLNYMKKERPDVLITNLVAIPAIFATRFLEQQPRVIASIQGFPKFLGGHDQRQYPVWMKVEDAIRRQLWNLVYVHADLLVCMTECTQHKLIRHTTLPVDRFAVVNNPVIDDEVFRMANRSPNDPWLFSGEHKRLIAIGRLTNQKDFLTLIKAVELASRELPIRLAILGEGEERAPLEKEIKDRSLSDNVRLYGFVRNPYAYLANADLFVLTSLWEDPGHAILEAAALSVPIVSTDCQSGPAILLANGKGGGLCAVGDVECLSREILASLRAGRQPEKLRIAYENSEKYTLRAHFDALQSYLDEWGAEAGR